MRLDATVDRDSVCAGDDCEPHAAEFATSPGTSIAEFLGEAQRARPLAGIAGGKATWLIDIDGRGRGCIGVVAQQWPGPRLLVPPGMTVAELFGDRKPTVHFRYWCQADPEAVFEALKGGSALPSPYPETA